MQREFLSIGSAGRVVPDRLEVEGLDPRGRPDNRVSPVEHDDRREVIDAQGVGPYSSGCWRALGGGIGVRLQRLTWIAWMSLSRLPVVGWLRLSRVGRGPGAVPVLGGPSGSWGLGIQASLRNASGGATRLIATASLARSRGAGRHAGQSEPGGCSGSDCPGTRGPAGRCSVNGLLEFPNAVIPPEKQDVSRLEGEQPDGDDTG